MSNRKKYFNFRCDRLTWHSGLIPKDEIWIKVGGDKGGGTFKLCFQIANVPCPNSSQNTVVFHMFEGPDSYPNVKLAVEQYVPAIEKLKQSVWKCVTS